MTNAPILRSSALQQALAMATTTAPVRRAPPAAGVFAAKLANARTPVAPSAARPATPVSAALPPGAVPFQKEITAAAARNGIDPALLAALVKQESSFNPNAQSGSGAKGLTQLMDSTASRLGVTNAFDPAQNLDAGAKFLGGLLKQFNGNESLALAAYNAGPGAVQKYGGIPPYEETQRYVPKVLGYAAQFRRLWVSSPAATSATSTSSTPLQTT